MRTGTPSKPRVDIKRLNLPPFEHPTPSKSHAAEPNGTAGPNGTGPTANGTGNVIPTPAPLHTPTRSQPAFALQLTPSRPRAEPNGTLSLLSLSSSFPSPLRSSFPFPTSSISPSLIQITEVPTLRNPNYYTKPAMETLKEMGSAELASVEGFVVGCVELGFVRWHGRTYLLNIYFIYFKSKFCDLRNDIFFPLLFASFVCFI